MTSWPRNFQFSLKLSSLNCKKAEEAEAVLILQEELVGNTTLAMGRLALLLSLTPEVSDPFESLFF